MNKIYSSISVILLLLSLIVIPVGAEACGGFFSAETDSPVTFDCLYPTTFYKTGVFYWGITIIVSLGVIVTCVFSFVNDLFPR